MLEHNKLLTTVALSVVSWLHTVILLAIKLVLLILGTFNNDAIVTFDEYIFSFVMFVVVNESVVRLDADNVSMLATRAVSRLQAETLDPATFDTTMLEAVNILHTVMLDVLIVGAVSKLQTEILEDTKFWLLRLTTKTLTGSVRFEVARVSMFAVFKFARNAVITLQTEMFETTMFDTTMLDAVMFDVVMLEAVSKLQTVRLEVYMKTLL